MLGGYSWDCEHIGDPTVGSTLLADNLGLCFSLNVNEQSFSVSRTRFVRGDFVAVVICDLGGLGD